MESSLVYKKCRYLFVLYRSESCKSMNNREFYRNNDGCLNKLSLIAALQTNNVNSAVFLIAAIQSKFHNVNFK